MIRFAVTLALAALAYAPAARASEPFQMMPADQVEKLLGSPDVHVFDANSRERFEQGRVPGAKHVTKDSVVQNLPSKKDATLIYYCTNPR